MSKVKKGKRVAAAAMAVALSMVTVTTGVLPNTTVHVHAEEDGSVYKKIADSSVDGFYYEQNVWGYIQCTTDKTLEYSSYDEMIILCLCGHVPGRPVLTVFCDPH